MRILHIIPTYLPSVNSRGVIDSMHFLNKELVRQGVDVTVYTTSADGAGGLLDVPIGKEVYIDGVKVLYFKPSFPRSWYFSSGLTKKLAGSAESFDVIHITSVFLAQSTLGGHYARKFNKPYIITPHGSLMKIPLTRHSWFKKIYISLIEKINLKNAILHLTTEAEKNQYLEARLPCKNMFVISNAMDANALFKNASNISIRKKFGISDNAPLILCLGRLNRIKGFDTLIPAFKKVVEKHATAVLLIVGPDDDGYKKEIQKLISDFKVEDNIIFSDALLGEDKLAAYTGANLLVAPSYSENFGMVITEAMSVGLPVIVTEGVGISSFISAAGAGSVVKKDEESLAGAMLELIDNPNKARQLGAAGTVLAEKEFSPENVAKRFIEEYNKGKRSY